MSMVVSAFTAVAYVRLMLNTQTYFGIGAPFIISMLFSLFAMIALGLLWDENIGTDDVNENNTYV